MAQKHLVKGLFKQQKEFKDGSLLKYTQMKWLTPKDHYIHGKVFNQISN